MKLNYRDKIILLIFIVIAIIIVFVAWPIRTTKEKIKENTVRYEKLEKEEKEKRDRIEKVKFYNKKIEETYELALPLADNFIEPMEPYKRDQFMQKFFDENNAEIIGSYEVKLSEATSLEYYAYTPHVVIYPILEAADMNGTLLMENDAESAYYLYRALQSTNIKPQDVEVSSLKTVAKVKREDLAKFLDAVKNAEKGKGIRVVEMGIKDYTFGKNAENGEDSGYASVELLIEFYSMQKIQKPNLD